MLIRNKKRRETEKGDLPIGRVHALNRYIIYKLSIVLKLIQ